MALTNQQYAEGQADIISRRLSGVITEAQFVTEMTNLIANAGGIYMPGKLAQRLEEVFGESVVVDAIRDGQTATAPSENAVFDGLISRDQAIAAKFDKAGGQLTGNLKMPANGAVFGFSRAADYALFGGPNFNEGAGVLVYGDQHPTSPSAVVFTRGAFSESGRFNAAGEFVLQGGLKLNGNEDLTGPWTPYTPTFAPDSGGFGSASATGAYKRFGKTVVGVARPVIVTAGSAAGRLLVGVPFPAARETSISGREAQSTGSCFVGSIIGGLAYLTRFDGAAIIGSNYTLPFAFAYEAA